MGDQYLGEIRLIAFNFAPVGWALCNGQMMSVAQFTALFSLLGNYYGGDGRTTFALPDLRSRVAIGVGQGTGLSQYTIGSNGGAEQVNLNAGNLPPHAHNFALSANNTGANLADPTNAYLGLSSDADGVGLNTYTQTAGNVTMAQQTTSVVGQGTPVATLTPYLALNYMIAVQGIYPPRQ